MPLKKVKGKNYWENEYGGRLYVGPLTRAQLIDFYRRTENLVSVGHAGPRAGPHPAPKTEEKGKGKE
jgi:hypothetical protein